MKRIIAAAAFAVALAAPLAANAADTMYSDWSAADMRSVLTGMGMTVTGEDTNDSGYPIIFARTPNGFNFDIYGTECTKAGSVYRCSGAEMTATIDYETVPRANEVYEKINFAALKYYMADRDTIAMTRYIIFDFGITRKNLETNIRVFTNLSEKVWNY